MSFPPGSRKLREAEKTAAEPRGCQQSAEEGGEGGEEEEGWVWLGGKFKVELSYSVISDNGKSCFILFHRINLYFSRWILDVFFIFLYENDNDMQGEHSCWRSSWSEQSSGKAQSGRWWEKQQQQVETFLFIAFYEFFCSSLMTLINFRDDDTSNPASTSSTPLATKVWKALHGKNLCRIKLYVRLELMINRSIAFRW